MKKITAAVLALAMALMMCACGAAKPQTTKTPDDTATPAPTDEVQKSEQVKVELQPATDEALSKYSETCQIDDKPDEYAQKLIVTVSSDVTELKVCNLTGEEKGDVFAFTESEVGSAPTLTADKPLVLWASFPGTLPTRGFSFVDASGETRHFAIEESGMDGSMFLTELVDDGSGALVYKPAE